MTSKWKDSYLAYEHQQARWPAEGHRLLRDLVYGANPPEYWLEQYILPRPDEMLIAEAVHIRPVIREAMQLVSFPRKEPLEDVYHAAIYLASAPEHWEHAETCYRGQCNRAWPALPSLYRAPRGAQELTSEEYDLRLSRLATFSEALNIKYPDRFEPYQCIAIGQHYGLHTWLLDLTSDPWVGLFFASLGGEKGQVGVLARFSTVEWDGISSGGENSLGSMTLIAVPGIPRIEAQKALFLNGSHPDLIEQYVAEKLEFRQTEGLVFESDYKGVSKEKLLSDDESFATFTKEWLSIDRPPTSQVLEVQPLRSARQPLLRGDYREILQTLIRRAAPTHAISKEVDSLLNWLCSFHAEIQRPVYRIPVQHRSIHHLISTADFIFANEIFSVDHLKGFYPFDYEIQRQVLENLEMADGGANG